VTAEIAVMNEEAIALAADSAVSSSSKIFTSANKIFALSKYHPVGVMVFARAQFLNVPWETIIKQYRRQLGVKSFSTLEEHAEDFLKFFNGKNALFPPDAQERSALMITYDLFQLVLAETAEKVARQKAEGNTPSDAMLVKATEESIGEQLARWTAGGQREGLPKGYRAQVNKRYGPKIDETIATVFSEAKLSKGALAELRQLVSAYLASEDYYWLNLSQSGIVIAGFGSEDVFPRLARFYVHGIASNRLKSVEIETLKVSHEMPAVISPFAQDEEVVTFMEGISPALRRYLDSWITGKLLEVLSEAGEHLKMSEAKTAEMVKAMSGRCLEAVGKDLEEDLAAFKWETSIDPIINVVRMLPKDELAAMAESLVNLTSFKRRVTTERETVGGPIDVAVISRGDGFIWIKRKHYFSSGLNPQFAANYYRETESDD
jgi:hypothetical protein